MVCLICVIVKRRKMRRPRPQGAVEPLGEKSKYTSRNIVPCIWKAPGSSVGQEAMLAEGFRACYFLQPNSRTTLKVKPRSRPYTSCIPAYVA